MYARYLDVMWNINVDANANSTGLKEGELYLNKTIKNKKTKG